MQNTQVFGSADVIAQAVANYMKMELNAKRYEVLRLWAVKTQKMTEAEVDAFCDAGKPETGQPE